MRSISMSLLILGTVILMFSAAGCGKKEEELAEVSGAVATTAAIETSAETEDTTEQTTKQVTVAATSITTSVVSESSGTEPVTTSTDVSSSTTASRATTTATVAGSPSENGNHENQDEVPQEEQPQEVIVEEPEVVIEEPAPEPQEEPAPVPEPQPENVESVAPPAAVSGDELTFVYNGQSLKIGDSAEAFVKANAPVSQESAPSCYGNGENINYYYDTFTIYTWNENGNYMTYGIDITGADMPTSRGIKIGSTLDEVKNAYGAFGNQIGDEYVYTFDDDSLRFLILDNVVASISYNRDL